MIANCPLYYELAAGAFTGLVIFGTGLGLIWTYVSRHNDN